MKKVFIAAIMYLSVLTTNTFAEVKMGIILGFTGPIESLTPAIAASSGPIASMLKSMAHIGNDMVIGVPRQSVQALLFQPCTTAAS